jgi:hypothetical protein
VCTAATVKCVPIRLALRTYLEDVPLNVDDLQVAVHWAPPQVGTECLEIHSSFISTEDVLQIFMKEKCMSLVCKHTTMKCVSLVCKHTTMKSYDVRGGQAVWFIQLGTRHRSPSHPVCFTLHIPLQLTIIISP